MIMYVLLRLKTLIRMSLLLTIFLKETKSDQKVSGPGASSCTLGMVATSCLIDDAPLDDFPDSCTSFLFEELVINEKHEVQNSFNDENNKYLDVFARTGKKIYAYIRRDNYTEWMKMLDCDGQNAMKDADGIEAFNTHHPGIKGLLLRALQPNLNYEKVFEHTQMLSKYIETVKDKTGLEVALEIISYRFLEDGSCLNFTTLNSSVDFYVFGLFSFLYDCTETLRNGTPPIDGDEKYTLEKLEAAIRASRIPKEKVYFNVYLPPRSKEDGDYMCDVNYQSLCAFPEKAKLWCADTQETQFKKGQWFRQNGAGFIGHSIDFDDPRGCCNCGQYPTFNAILAGFNGTASVPKCPLYDRLC